MPKNLVVVGKITGPHGIKGGLKVVPLTDFPEQRFAKGKYLYLDSRRKLRISSVNSLPKAYLLFFDGINDRNAAEELKGSYIYTSETDKVILPEDSYMTSDIMGCSVVDEKGEDQGAVIDVLYGKANDVYVLSRKGKEFMIPAIKEAITGIDIDKKVITVKRDYLCET